MARRKSSTPKVKVEKFHSEAPADVYELLNNVIEEYHDDLSDSEFLVLMKHGGWKSKGKTVFGKVKVLGDDLRRSLKKDVILYLNADMWRDLKEPQKRYVLDHVLYSLNTKTDRHGDTQAAKDGRPLLKTEPPDIECFAKVIERHGVIMAEVKLAADAFSNTKVDQLTIEDAAVEAPPEEPREGVRGTINPDGTINLDEGDDTFDERNQVTIEQVVEPTDTATAADDFGVLEE